MGRSVFIGLGLIFVIAGCLPAKVENRPPFEQQDQTLTPQESALKTLVETPTELNPSGITITIPGADAVVNETAEGFFATTSTSFNATTITIVASAGKSPHGDAAPTSGVDILLYVQPAHTDFKQDRHSTIASAMVVLTYHGIYEDGRSPTNVVPFTIIARDLPYCKDIFEKAATGGNASVPADPTTGKIPSIPSSAGECDSATSSFNFDVKKTLIFSVKNEVNQTQTAEELKEKAKKCALDNINKGIWTSFANLLGDTLVKQYFGPKQTSTTIDHKDHLGNPVWSKTFTTQRKIGWGEFGAGLGLNFATVGAGAYFQAKRVKDGCPL